MFDYIEFERVEGRKPVQDLRLIGLSTCGFCKRAVAFLDEQGVAYSYVYVDRLDGTVKQRAKDDFFVKYGRKMLFPVLLIGDHDYLTGFLRLQWEKAVEQGTGV